MTRRSAAPDGTRWPEKDDRPPICPACGVTMGMVVADDGSLVSACLECGFDENGASTA